MNFLKTVETGSDIAGTVDIWQGEYPGTDRVAIIAQELGCKPPHCRGVGTVTVHIPEAKISEGEVIVKTWSENFGWARSVMRQLGYEDTKKRIGCGMADAEVWRKKKTVVVLGTKAPLNDKRPILPTPTEFWDMCKSHDWHHAYSDDHTAYTRGSDEARRIRRIAAESKDLMVIYRQWSDHMNSGPAFGTERAPMPPRPGV